MNLELTRRIVFTLGALLAWRVGDHIPLPWITRPATIDRGHSGGGLGQITDLLLGGQAGRVTIFALGIMPYITAALLMQLAMWVPLWLRARAWRGERGSHAINQRTLYLTVALAAVQALGVANGLESMPGFVADPGWLFVISTTVTLTGGTIFQVWLSQQITLRGVGNGLALILTVGIVTAVPGNIAVTLELMRRGALAGNQLGAVAMIVVAITGLVVLMERARSRIPVVYPERRIGHRAISNTSSDLSLKLNCAGLVPPILASWLLSILWGFVPLIVGQGSDWVARALSYGQPLNLVVYGVRILLCALLYAGFVMNPDEIAASLRKYGGSVPSIAPGDSTAGYIDGVLSRITTIGVGYLVLVCLLPEILLVSVGAPFLFGGPALLIVVCTLLDLEVQVRETARRAGPL